MTRVKIEVVTGDCRMCGRGRCLGRGGVCVHPEIGSRQIPTEVVDGRWVWPIPEWCPLEDAVGRLLDWSKEA